MSLVDLYVKEVGQHLPAASREDIEKEIRTLIEDTLDDEAGTLGRPIDREMTVDVLKRLGSPQKMAARYLPERYLIGPRLFPQYLTVLKIVLAVVSIVVVIGLAVATGISPDRGVSFVEMFRSVVTGLIEAVFQAAAIVTIVFAVLEYAQPNIKLTEERWDPLTLRAQTDSERVSLVGGALTVLFTLIFALVLNFYPEWMSIWHYNDNGEWLHTPLLAEVFFRNYLPFLNVLWAAEIVKEIVLMARGRWIPSLRWADVAINLATAVLAAIMLTGPAIIAIDAVSFNDMGWGSVDASTVQALTNGLQIAARITIGIIMGVSLIEMGKGLYRIVEERRMLAAA